MAKFRRIGTVALQWRDARVPDAMEREREAVLSYIAEAGSMDVDILLFQEAFGFISTDLSSVSTRHRYAPGAGDSLPPAAAKAYTELAVSLGHAYVQKARRAAQSAGVNVVLPILERHRELVYNSLVPITAEGEILRPYRKMFPVTGPRGEHWEIGEVTPGEDNGAQLLAGVPVSFAICWDVHFDEVFVKARRSGARLVLWASAWMGGPWLRAQALRFGFYIVSATPDGCTFVDMDGTTIVESAVGYPQTYGHSNLIFEDLNFDRDVFHTTTAGALDGIRQRYGGRVHIRCQPFSGIAVIETLDPNLSIEEVKREFDLVSLYDYFEASRDARARVLAERTIR
ncbi:MAG: carbon-nitrogen hydrolase family protein [Anaerolineae bacterium]